MGALDYEPHYTYSDYKDWKGKWELYDGYPISMSPSPMISHQAIAYELAYELRRNMDCDRCLIIGEEDWKLSDDTVLRPDVVLICDEPNDAYITKAPQIIIEVISPSTAKRDEGYKFKTYEKEKVLYYCIVYPDDLKAKLYKLKDGKFDKEGDFSSQSYDFEDSTCKTSINFENVFKRFKK
ncbi:MAG: Uma2 family endonuclease [Campylobacterota bacterium]|nr:Uma2 family endonuclease [Campylobacterota bacterium]